MKIYGVAEHSWDGVRTSKTFDFVAKNPKAAITKAARFIGYTLSKRYDKVERLENGLYIVSNTGKNFRPVHNYKFSVC